MIKAFELNWIESFSCHDFTFCRPATLFPPDSCGRLSSLRCILLCSMSPLDSSGSSACCMRFCNVRVPWSDFPQRSSCCIHEVLQYSSSSIRLLWKVFSLLHEVLQYSSSFIRLLWKVFSLLHGLATRNTRQHVLVWSGNMEYQATHLAWARQHVIPGNTSCSGLAMCNTRQHILLWPAVSTSNFSLALHSKTSRHLWHHGLSKPSPLAFHGVLILLCCFPCYFHCMYECCMGVSP